MGAFLGQDVVVKLPAHVVQMYNDQYPANPTIAAGDVRPGKVVGINPVVKDGPETVNVVFYHDGPEVHYVRNVPVSVLETPGEDTSIPEENANPDAGLAPQRAWDPALEGNGSTYAGPPPGASATADAGPAQSPEVGGPVAGVPVNPQWSNATPTTTEEAPSNEDNWQS